MMKILIPKSSLAISLIAPLALQWATNLGNNPAGFADLIRREVLNTLTDLHKHNAISFMASTVIAAFIKELVLHDGGVDVDVEIRNVTNTYYLISTTFHVLGTPGQHRMLNVIYTDDRSPK